MRAAAARRRRVLVLLLAGTMVTVGASGFGALPWWSGLVPAALIVLFLVVARRQVRRASEDYWEEAGAADHAADAESSDVVRRQAVRVEASHGAARPAPGAAVGGDDEPTVTLTAEELASVAAGLREERVVAVTVRTADGGSLWDPLPVTLPTYVDKPVAPRTVRTIDLSADDVFSAGHDLADETAADGTPEGAGAEESEPAAEPVETPKVVNG